VDSLAADTRFLRSELRKLRSDQREWRGAVDGQLAAALAMLEMLLDQRQKNALTAATSAPADREEPSPRLAPRGSVVNALMPPAAGATSPGSGRNSPSLATRNMRAASPMGAAFASGLMLTEPLTPQAQPPALAQFRSLALASQMQLLQQQQRGSRSASPSVSTRTLSAPSSSRRAARAAAALGDSPQLGARALGGADPSAPQAPSESESPAEPALPPAAAVAPGLMRTGSVVHAPMAAAAPTAAAAAAALEALETVDSPPPLLQRAASLSSLPNVRDASSSSGSGSSEPPAAPPVRRGSVSGPVIFQPQQQQQPQMVRLHVKPGVRNRLASPSRVQPHSPPDNAAPRSPSPPERESRMRDSVVLSAGEDSAAIELLSPAQSSSSQIAPPGATDAE
jgi:hypothetical protein